LHDAGVLNTECGTLPRPPRAWAAGTALICRTVAWQRTVVRCFNGSHCA